MLSAPTAGADDRTDGCAGGEDDVAGPAQNSNFYVFQMIVNTRQMVVGIRKEVRAFVRRHFSRI
jgi:hypothetical protein